MTVKPRFNGKERDAALKMLRRITTILEIRNIPYLLDGGTLLGIIRDGSLIEWDYDMDISVTEQEFRAVAGCAWRLRLRGYWVAIRRHKVERPPLRMGDPRVIKIRNRRFGILAGLVKMDIFIKYRHAGRYYWLEGSRRRSAVKSVPAEFFDEVTTTTFAGKDYWIPNNFEGYLECRYGDWQKPVKEWDHLADDGAITSG